MTPLAPTSPHAKAAKLLLWSYVACLALVMACGWAFVPLGLASLGAGVWLVTLPPPASDVQRQLDELRREMSAVHLALGSTARKGW